MARYVLSQRRAGKFDTRERLTARRAADEGFASLFAASSDLIGRLTPADETAREVIVFEASPQEVTAKATLAGPDVLIEPEVLHYPVTVMPPDVAHLRADNAPGVGLAGTGISFTVQVRSATAGRLLGAEVVLFLRGPGGLDNRLSSRTNQDGTATFAFSEGWTPAALIVTPAGDHWTMVVRGPTDQLEVELPELPQLGPLGWWHRRVGITQPSLELGQGITVGVVDTGTGPHPHLDHAGTAGAFIDGQHDPSPPAGHDVDMHGSHVSGTIGARPPDGSDQLVGVAPGVNLVGARVFPTAEDGANQGDIAAAIEHLSRERGADLINLSLGASTPSEIERDAIADALERGTLCVCAAANSAGPVEFPAAFAESAAISALGVEGWGPAGSLSSIRLPTQPDRFGVDGLYLANFSCFGPEIAGAAPGVGIIATVPQRLGLTAPHGAMDGTSMASPMACGVLAALCSKHPTYLALPRNLSRAEQARTLLRQCCIDIGLSARFQGNGLATLA
jgi:hypothetical protein